MNAFEVAQLTNDRINGGTESKFPVTLAIVNELLLFSKFIGYFEVAIDEISSGDSYDDYIITLINELNDENELKMMENVHNYFTPVLRLVRTASPLLKILIPVVAFGYEVYQRIIS